MKRKYYILIIILILEGLIVDILKHFGIDFNAMSLGVRSLLQLVLSIPIVILLYLLGNDKNISNIIRIFAKLFIIFMIICYISASIYELYYIN